MYFFLHIYICWALSYASMCIKVPMGLIKVHVLNAQKYFYFSLIIIIAFSLIVHHNQNSVDSITAKRTSFNQYGYSTCGTHARVLSRTLANGEQKERNRTKKVNE